MSKRESQHPLDKLKKYLTADTKTRALMFKTQGDLPEIPSYQAMEYLRDVNNQWGIHFTRDKPSKISREGFTKGTGDISRLNRTKSRVSTGIGEEKLGYNFAYLEGDNELDTTTPQRQYGSVQDGYRAVAFLAKRGLLTKHMIDNDQQLIVWGSDIPTGDIFPLVYSSSSGKWHIPLNMYLKVDAGSTIPEALKYIKDHQEELRAKLGKTNPRSLEGKTIAAASIVSLTGGLFFLSSNITGNAIGSSSMSNIIGVILLLAGIFGTFFWFTSRK
jgi:hypothetical protein